MNHGRWIRAERELAEQRHADEEQRQIDMVDALIKIGGILEDQDVGAVRRDRVQYGVLTTALLTFVVAVVALLVSAQVGTWWIVSTVVVLAALTGVALRQFTKKPMLSTEEATAAKRRRGLPGLRSRRP